MAVRPAWRRSRRRSNAASILSREALVFSFSLRAARAPYCTKVVALEDIWLWSSATALAIGGGATSVPSLHPVIEYVLEKPEATIVRDSASGPSVARQVGVRPP